MAKSAAFSAAFVKSTGIIMFALIACVLAE
jgi:hypothetical protein